MIYPVAPDSKPTPERDLSHPLDNLVWSSLTTKHASFAIGNALARRYPADVAGFVALETPTPAGFAALAEILSDDEDVVMFTVGDIDPGPAFEVSMRRDIAQMIHHHAAMRQDTTTRHPLQAMTPVDVPDMLDLVARTEPGPFKVETIRMGRYLGMRVDGKLIALTGERMHPTGYTEVSAVCVDPAFRGQGLSTQLIAAIIDGIVARGETPILHAFTTNRPALDVYRRIGFVDRQRLRVTVMRRKVFAS